MNQWSAPPSQHRSLDKKTVQADWLRLCALGSLFLLGLASTLSTLWILLLLGPVRVFLSLLSLSLPVSALLVYLCARGWLLVIRKQITEPRRLFGIIVLCLLALGAWVGFYYCIYFLQLFE